jgi:hypothetical protein
MTDSTLLHDLTDRREIADLVSRLGLWLDEGRFDEALIDLDGDRAAVRANLVVTFADDAVTSQHSKLYRFEAVRTPDGWRLSRVEVLPVWKLEP